MDIVITISDLLSSISPFIPPNMTSLTFEFIILIYLYVCLQILMDELREEAAQDPENDSPEGELPDYMLRMIQQFEDNDIIVVENDEVGSCKIDCRLILFCTYFHQCYDFNVKTYMIFAQMNRWMQKSCPLYV